MEREPEITRCAWCGTDVRQTGVGRRRAYCRRSCRQRAYEARQEEDRLVLDRARHRRIWEAEARATETSRDESRGAADLSRDETLPPAPMAPRPPVLSSVWHTPAWAGLQPQAPGRESRPPSGA